MAADTTFTLTFKTIADATGLTQIASGIQAVKTQVQSAASTINSGLQFVGLSLGVRELNDLGAKALEVKENIAAWTLQMLRGKDGSQQLVQELNVFNEELEKTTGTLPATSRAIEQLFSRAGLTGDQIKQATKGVIEFAASSAGTAQPLELATVLARRFAGAASEMDISLQRFGIHAKDLPGILAELQTRGGNFAEVLKQQSAGMKDFETASEHAKIAIGNFVNIVRVPFLTGLTGSLNGVKTNLDAITTSESKAGDGALTWTEKIAVAANTVGNVISNIKNVLAALDAATDLAVSFIRAALLAGTSLIANGVQQIIQKAVDELQKFVQFAADTARTLSFGAINVDVSPLFNKIRDQVNTAGDGVRTAFTKDFEQTEKVFTESLDQLNKAVDSMGVKLFSPEFIANVRKQLATLQSTINFSNVQPGSGVTGLGGDNAAKAATDALTVAKFQLSQAEEKYRTELEAVKVLEDTGAIDGQRADQLRIQAGQQYLQTLRQIESEMPKLIAQQQAAGNVKGVQELQLEWQKVRLEELKTLDAIANSTFWGKIGVQIRGLANQWADLGKQIGTFVTQQFQNFAQTAGNAIGQLVTGTLNWKQAITQLVQSFVSGLATMLIQWILSRTIMAALNKAFGQADVATASAQASGAAAAWAPAGIAASIATYGVAASLGTTAFLTAIGLGTAGATAASSAGGIEGYAAGDLTPERPTMAMVSERGPEFIFSNPAVRALGVQNLRNLHQLALSGIARPASSVASPGGGSVASNSRDTEIKHEHFFFLDAGEAFRAWLNSTAGRKEFRRIQLGNRV